MRLGRDRKRATAWGDEWENFGYAHLSKGHLGVGKGWIYPSVTTYWVQETLRNPNGIYPDLNDLHNDQYIRCEEYCVFGLDSGSLRRCRDGLLLGVKTAFQRLESF